MPDFERSLGNAQTLWTELSTLEFRVLEQSGGYAMVIRFRLHNEQIRQGDTLVVLEGPEIRFHGMITSVDDEGWAAAADRRGSTIPAGVH
jgi:hypothetical protein